MWGFLPARHLLLLLLLFGATAAGVAVAKIHGNPANDLVDLINSNRTVVKLKNLYVNSGLGCMALQYAAACSSNCTGNGTITCHPPEADVTEIYAPNCGVELPTMDIISAHLIGCRWAYHSPEDALAAVLASDRNASAIIRSKEYTEIGVGFDRAGRHGAFVWCVLLSGGGANSTFVLEEGGKGIVQRDGCFSATGLSCSSAVVLAVRSMALESLLAVAAIIVACNFIL